MVKHVKIAATAMAVCLSMSALAACSSKSDSSESGGSASASKPSISVSVFDRGTVSSEEGTYESNRWTKWINENSPTKVDWVPVPRNEAQTKLNTLIASGSAPDLIWEYSRDYIVQLANQGAIQPIDEYLDKYSTSYKAYLESHSELLPYLKIDGKMYAVASERGIDSVANHGMWIRKDWLDKLGLDAPATVEELLEVARKFQTEDPDGNGKDDTVPIVFNYNFPGILQAFFQANSTQWYAEGEGVQLGRLLDRYEDYLSLHKQLFDEKLIDQEYITDSNYTRAMQNWTTGKAGILFGSWNMESQYRDLVANVPDAEMVPLESLETKYGKNGLYQEAPPGIYVAFNSDMKEDEIEAAFKFLDWLIDGGWEPLKQGEEGVHYQDVNGVPQTIDADKFKTEAGYAYEYAIVNQSAPQPEWFPIMAASDEVSQAYAKQKAASLETAMKNTYRRDIAYAPGMAELTQLMATFDPIAQQIEAKVVTGGPGMTPAKGMEELRSEWKRLGGDTINQQVNKWYAENKDQLTTK
ncbi:extracellular solute-binding protein [Cohnella fermenti]|uniref:Extracellular solute-binding protein n=1 Tax=Cohnella fermenti TaxID=2565925 RepID=A0A4S4BWE9_9BACL|nr:extracellular solute-binding protein [Cohnella fermenti]THF78773.1 extracellular solute-binding protein [Cohnella fermenti]